MLYLWDWFRRLSRRRGSSGNGANPISHRDIEAFARLYRIPIHPWEVEALERIDDVVLKVWNEKTAKPEAAASEPHLIPANDTKRIGAMLRGMAASRKAR